MNEHVAHEHSWELSALVISTLPLLKTWFCACGAATHDPKQERLCSIRHFDFKPEWTREYGTVVRTYNSWLPEVEG